VTTFTAGQNVPIVGGALDGKTWPVAAVGAPTTFVHTQSGQAYALSGSKYVRAAGSDVAAVADAPFDPNITVVGTTPNLANAYRGSAYNLQLGTADDGDNGPYAWELIDGSLPDGISLVQDGSSSLWSLDGAPTTLGASTFTLRVTDKDGNTGTVTWTLNVVELTLEFAPVDIKGGFIGIAYSEQLNCQGSRLTGGAVGPLVWRVDDDSVDPLPSGLSIASGGLITGTPTTAQSKLVTFRVTNGSDGNYDLYTVTISITDPPVTTFTAVNNRAMSATAVSTAGGEVRSSAYQAPAVVGGTLRVAASQTITAGTPVTTFKLYKCATSGGTYVDTGLTITGFTGASSATSDVSAAGLAGLYLKLGATVTGSAAAALVTADISIVGHS
jgi:hypothetical protein